jgi:serine/threonine protein kinase
MSVPKPSTPPGKTTEPYRPNPLVSASDQSGTPRQFGRYRILKTLGRGGMGAVYLAHDPTLDRQVALKIPFFEPEDKDKRKRFYREAKAAATLTHPNICPVYEVGEEQGRPYLTMAFIEGHTLDDLIRQGHLSSPRQAVQLVGKLALTLQEAHDKRIVHRDLKPANIMLSARQEPVIMDFGLAKRAVENTANPHLTNTGDMMGTPAYMPPEQMEGDLDTVGPRSDIYSLGVILFELLTGKRPFTGTIGAIMNQVLSDTPPPSPMQLRPDVDPALAAICQKAMAKKVEQRYGSMKEFADALKEYLQPAPSTMEALPSPSGVKTVTQNRSAATAVQTKTAPPLVDAVPASKRGLAVKLLLMGAGVLVVLILGAVVYWVVTEGMTPQETPTPPRDTPTAGTPVSPVVGRYVRIELPGPRRTLTLAEVEVYSQGRNVARQGKATQSSILRKGQMGGQASRAIDGNTSGEYFDGGQTHTEENTPDPWWEVDLGEAFPIDQIVIYNRELPYGRRLRGFTLRVFDADHKTVVFERTDQPAPERTATFNLHEKEAAPATKPTTPALQPGFSWPAEALRQGRITAPDLSQARLLFKDEFTDAESGFAVMTTAGRSLRYEKGSYRLQHFDHGASRAHRLKPMPGGEFICEVVARVKGGPTNAWGVQLNNFEQLQGIRVGLKGDGSIQIGPGHSADFPAGFRGPQREPFSHAAVKTGEEFNTILLILRTGYVEVFINGCAVCDPIIVEKDWDPDRLQFTLHSTQGAEVEFKRLTVWSVEGIPTPAERLQRGDIPKGKTVP